MMIMVSVSMCQCRANLQMADFQPPNSTVVSAEVLSVFDQDGARLEATKVIRNETFKVCSANGLSVKLKCEISTPKDVQAKRKCRFQYRHIVGELIDWRKKMANIWTDPQEENLIWRSGGEILILVLPLSLVPCKLHSIFEYGFSIRPVDPRKLGMGVLPESYIVDKTGRLDSVGDLEDIYKERVATYDACMLAVLNFVMQSTFLEKRLTVIHTR